MISGPLNNGGSLLTILQTNNTHPARVRCQATCLDHQGTSYRPAMALILRGQEHYIPIVPVYGHRAHDSFNNYSKHGLHFISYCEAQNNYIMEYEYLITSNASKSDCSVVFCGNKYYYSHNDYNQVCTCWGQSYGIIHAEVDTLADYQTPTNPSSTQAAYTSIQFAVNDCSSCSISYYAALSATSLVSTLISIILVIIIITIILPLTIGFLYLRSRKRQKSNVFAPLSQCVQTVEQSLVIKVEEPVASESAAVREKETSFSEKSDSSRSSIQAQLQEKLPDTISSRSKTL